MAGALAAGDFSSWLRSMAGALRGDGDSDVPCDGCTACCRSSQFVSIGPDEVDTLAHIPDALQFPAPGRPPGHVVLGYDERGHCPMLIDDRCSIYERRPRACRIYDCRVFPAAGVEPDQPLVAAQARQWEFCYDAGDSDGSQGSGGSEGSGRAQHDALRAAAAFVSEHADGLAAGSAAVNPTQRAVLAVELHDLFVGTEPSPTEVRVELRRRERYRAGEAGSRPSRKP